MLTPKQEKFAKNIALEGMNYSDAYRNAYNCKKMTDKTINDTASKLKDNPDIAQRIAELKREIDSPQIMSAIKRAEKVSKLAEDTEDPNIMLKAIDLLNKMSGEYVQKVQAEVSTELNINIELSDE